MDGGGGGGGWVINANILPQKERELFSGSIFGTDKNSNFLFCIFCSERENNKPEVRSSFSGLGTSAIFFSRSV